jgi:transcriptional regulator of aromatic amino acid metabolism
MPGDTQPHLARQEKRRTRRPRPGTVKQLTAVLWRAITHLETHLDATVEGEEVDTGELCKLSHALSQSAATYLKAVEVGELEARLETLERELTATKDAPGRWAA